MLLLGSVGPNFTKSIRSKAFHKYREQQKEPTSSLFQLARNLSSLPSSVVPVLLLAIGSNTDQNSVEPRGFSSFLCQFDKNLPYPVIWDLSINGENRRITSRHLCT